MNPEYFDLLGDQLVAASQREHRRHTARPRRWQKMTRRPLFVALAALVLAASALAATQPWAPQELTANSNSDPPTLSAAPVPSTQSSSFEVLRRPQSAVDRGPATRAALKYVHAGGTTGVKTNDIRLLNPGAMNQPPVVLVPAASGKTGPGRTPDVLCLVAVEPQTGAGTGKLCLNGGMIGSRQIQGQLKLFIFGLVPDGVAAVRVTFPDAPPTVAPVHENFYGFDSTTDTFPDALTTWLDAAGHPVP